MRGRQNMDAGGKRGRGIGGGRNVRAECSRWDHTAQYCTLITMREAAWDTKILADSSFLSVCVCVCVCVCGCVCTYVWKDDEACLYRSNLYGHLTPASLSHSISLLTRATLKHIPDWSGGGFPFMWPPLCVHRVMGIYFFSFMHYSVYSFIWIAVHFNKVIGNPLFYVHIKENN